MNAVQKHYGEAPSQNRARTRRILIGARHLKCLRRGRLASGKNSVPLVSCPTDSPACEAPALE